VNKIYAFAIVAFIVVGGTYAGITSDQGAGNPTTQEWFNNVAARRAARDTEVCVTNSAGGQVVTNATTALTQRKSVELQNQGPNAIFCTLDGSTPFADSRARSIAASGGSLSVGAGPALVITCIAATAAQVAHVCTHMLEVQ